MSLSKSLSALSGGGASISLSACSSDKIQFARLVKDVSPSAANDQTQDCDVLAWQEKAAQVEEGWITVTSKKSKASGPSLEMTLRSHKINSKCKT